jgi:hypothetical protein
MRAPTLDALRTQYIECALRLSLRPNRATNVEVNSYSFVIRYRRYQKAPENTQII